MARRGAVALLMLAVVAVLLWAGVRNYHVRQATMEHARQAQLVLSKDGTASITAETSPLGKDLRGKPAPDFTLASVDGKKIALASFKGKPTIINFWATYCGPCKLEMPWFEEFSHKYSAQGLQVIGIDDEDGVTSAQVKAAAQKVGVTYPILIDTQANGSAYGLGDYLPVTYYIDAGGNVVAQTPGAPSKETVEANIQKILGSHS
jgi:cytochrome c biogenesis protein CcmG/thiol:disulfide interchange protein DsbE